jgi:hypothetical protein
MSNVQPLEPPDTHFLSSALGWLGLGSLAEAKAELAQISAGRQQHPDVLEVRWLLCAEDGHWDQGLQVACRLLQVAPERSSGWLHQSYALRRVPSGGLQQAFDVLLPAFAKFPDEPTIPYNLACYACQLQELTLAREWFQRALKIGSQEQLRQMALADEDLEPLWDEIRRG